MIRRLLLTFGTYNGGQMKKTMKIYSGESGGTDGYI